MADTTRAPRAKRGGSPRLESGGNYAPARIVLADARRAGIPFETAWPRAVEAVPRSDRAVLNATAGAWRLEYEGRRSWGGDLMAALAVLDTDAGQRGDRAIA